ncbi:uncharacterized protein VP01_5656g1, partial [Puccinia sorghi]
STEVDSKQVNCNLFTKETEEDYTFENEDLSLKPTFERFDLQEVAVDRDGKDVTGNFDFIDLLAPNGKLLLRSVFDPTTKTWPLPKPSRSPNGVESSQFFFSGIVYLAHKLETNKNIGETDTGLQFTRQHAGRRHKIPGLHSERLSIVAIDLMGPSDPATMTVGKYALTVRDIYTTYTVKKTCSTTCIFKVTVHQILCLSEVRILMSKSDAADLLMTTLTRWETQTDRK